MARAGAGAPTDVCSCLSATWTFSVCGWELLPKFYRDYRLERLGNGPCTLPALFPSAQMWLRVGSVLWTCLKGQKTPTCTSRDLLKTMGSKANRQAAGQGLHCEAAALREAGKVLQGRDMCIFL